MEKAATKVSGFVLLDKPVGVTSHDVVKKVRQVLHTVAGHTGTLDPFASGLLMVLVGSATRLARFVPNEPKVYEAAVRFGVSTDSDDRTGTPVASAPLPDEDAVRAAAAQLTGVISQIPPIFSAKHVAGRRAYALARSGREVSLPAVEVKVHYWEFLGRQDDTWLVRVSCSSGTYVRALARDLGRLAGSAAHLAALRRTRIGPFDVSEALSLSDFLATPQVRPAAAALPHWPQEVVSTAQGVLVRQGARIPARVRGETALLVDASGELLAVAERHQDCWQPRVVLGAG
jgi:tRNA pseudouridine55 synthase